MYILVHMKQVTSQMQRIYNEQLKYNIFDTNYSTQSYIHNITVQALQEVITKKGYTMLLIESINVLYIIDSSKYILSPYFHL